MSESKYMRRYSSAKGPLYHYTIYYINLGSRKVVPVHLLVALMYMGKL